MELNSSNQLTFYLSTNSSGTLAAATDKTITDTTTWHHVVMTWDGINMKIFLDGQASSVITPKTGTLTNTTYNFSIGRVGDYNGFYFNGKIDETRIYLAKQGNQD